MVVSALNGQEVDWPQEFYHELTKKITTLHNKHVAAKVKVEKTSIGPHLTMILRAGGILNIRKELEDGYKSEKTLTQKDQLPNKETKTKEAKRVSKLQTTISIDTIPGEGNCHQSSAINGNTSLLCHNTFCSNLIRNTKEQGHFRDLKKTTTPKRTTCNGRTDLPSAS